MKKVLVTGANGYIGSVLVPDLLVEGYNISGIDSNLFLHDELLGISQEITKEKDIRDLTVEDLNGFDTIIHLAGLSNDPLGEINIDLTYEINTYAAVRVALLAREAGVKRFIFASSCSVYGGGGDKLLNEQAHLRPQTAYAKSKLLAEQEIQKLATEDFSPVFVRAGTVYGFSPRIRFDLVVNIFVRNVLVGTPLKIFGEGTLWRPLIHIDDVVAAYKTILSASKDQVHNKIFNIGSTQENYQVTGIARYVQECCPECLVEKIPTDGKDGRNYKISCMRFEGTFPGRKTISLKEGILDLYENLKKYPIERLKSSSFVRIASLKDKIDKGLFDTSLRRIQL